ncbi:hypothetical protein FNV43_RR13018 [Rhamnella rubrinervis]|uniref:Uncharacterized protein n=1 Tax=Rhamnella rubrinervis TaxID=2594499 RepID=A0A8K0H0B6_9ROSA|nr:hypothetical protein FNV43_RR13018 [Rhamnella rubrinervis]
MIAGFSCWLLNFGHVSSIYGMKENGKKDTQLYVFSYVEDVGDPYKDQMEQRICLIMEELKARVFYKFLLIKCDIIIISKFSGVVFQIISDILCLMLISFFLICFVNEHIETLEELDMEYKQLALESGILNWVMALL